MGGRFAFNGRNMQMGYDEKDRADMRGLRKIYLSKKLMESSFCCSRGLRAQASFGGAAFEPTKAKEAAEQEQRRGWHRNRGDVAL